MSSSNENQAENYPSWVPEGYVVVMSPDDQPCMVPEFIVPALQQMFDGYRKKDELEIEKAAGTSSKFNSPSFGVIGEGKIMAPTAPGSSERERLSAHAEILSLQDRFGISYKDASHRLYMAELEKLKAEEKCFKAVGCLQASTKIALEKAFNSVKDVEKESTEDMDTGDM